jgi:predicted GH43/DUF377 family glycosyl hydrolase
MNPARFLVAIACLTGVAGAAESAATELDLGAMIAPIPRSAVFRDPDFNIWCGSMVAGDDGKYHLFYSRWPRASGHQAWVTKSEIAHAIADQPTGPYHHADVALPARGNGFWDGDCTHNPTVIRANGKYYLYYMGNFGNGTYWDNRNHQRIGVAVADHPEGPWLRSPTPVLDVSPDPTAPDALMVSNPSVTQRPDGGFLMVYKGVAKKGKPPFGGPVCHLVALSDQPTGPFVKQPTQIFGKEGVTFAAEDPYIWRNAGDDRYRAVVKDNDGNFTHQGYSLALFESFDGLAWKLAAHPLVTTPQVTWADGTTQRLAALERPQLFCLAGQPAVLFCAAAEDQERVGSFNLAIPLHVPPAGK